MHIRGLVSLAALSLLAAGCGKSEIQVYDVPKDTRSSEPTSARQPAMMNQPAAPATSPMVNQALPEESLSAAGDPTWQVPYGWRQGPQSSVRRGSFVVGPAEAAGDVAITVFPGDVGGILANVNRWRQQIGLGPVSSADLADLVTDMEIDDREAQLVEFDGPSIGTIAAIVMVNGQSWFFRLTAPPATIASERATFIEFLHTVQFPE